MRPNQALHRRNARAHWRFQRAVPFPKATYGMSASLISSRLRRALAEQIQLYHTGIAAFAKLQICNLKR
jgi:hypothetical protein